MRFITGVNCLHISERLTDPGFEVATNCFLTNNPTQIEAMLGGYFGRELGRHEATYLVQNGCVLFERTKREFKSHAEAVNHLVHWLGIRGIFLQCLWLIRDNSVDRDTGFLSDVVRKKGQAFASFAPRETYTTAEGKVTVATFSPSELEHVRDSFYKPILASYNFSLQPVKREEGLIVSSDQGPRVGRAHYFLRTARTTDDTGVKMALYITCLEILFSNDSAELAHKLSERVACFLELAPKRRREVFAIVKRAYNLRSKVVHGDVVKLKDQKELPFLTREIDNMLRRIFQRLYLEKDTLDSIESTNQDREHYFEELYFGREGS
jgi:hypothetical protein